MSHGKPRVVAFCHTGLYGGAEVVLERVVRAAVEQGWKMTVLVPEGTARDRFIATGAVVRPGPDLRLPFGSKILGVANRSMVSVKVARLLRKAAKGHDVVLVNGVHSLPALALARLSVPTVWILHQVITSRSRLALVKLTAPPGCVTVAVSEAAAAPVRRLGLSVRVIHNGTPSPVPLAPNEPPSSPVVGCAAALTDWKGQDVLLEAVSRLDPHVSVELLGERLPKDAPYEQRLRARADLPDLSGRVRFLGFRDDPLEVMRSWTVAVSASVDPEAVGLTTLEAMSAGVPVVGTDIGATPSVLGGAGLLVPPRDPDAMAEAISRVINDVELWNRCHLAGPSRIAANFSLDRQLDSMLKLLEAMARGDSIHV